MSKKWEMGHLILLVMEYFRAGHTDHFICLAMGKSIERGVGRSVDSFVVGSLLGKNNHELSVISTSPQ